MVYQVNIVEDDDSSAEKINNLLERYAEENGVRFVVTRFNNGLKFLADYKGCDIIFMDIAMPNMNGMQATAQLRKRDNDVTVVFVTDLAQYAIKGYEVNAFDFIIKPVNYSSLAIKLKRILKMADKHKGKTLSLNTSTGIQIVNVFDIMYVEVRGHVLLFHLQNETIQTYGTLKEIMNMLKDYTFCKCNQCYYVNLYYVKAIEGDFVVVGEEQLLMSRRAKNDFTAAVNRYLGGRYNNV